MVEIARRLRSYNRLCSSSNVPDEAGQSSQKFSNPRLARWYLPSGGSQPFPTPLSQLPIIGDSGGVEGTEKNIRCTPLVFVLRWPYLMQSPLSSHPINWFPPSDSSPGGLSRRPPTPKVAPPSPVYDGSGVFHGGASRGRAQTADGDSRQRRAGRPMTGNQKVFFSEQGLFVISSAWIGCHGEASARKTRSCDISYVG